VKVSERSKHPDQLAHPEAYEDFNIGDRVYCLAWLGMPFVVVGKDDATGKIELDGDFPCSLPDGAKVDIEPHNRYMISHNLWDQIWYWPDRAGQTYEQVLDRFVSDHRENQLVESYLLMPGHNHVDREPQWASTLRVSFAAFTVWNQIYAQPVAALGADGKSLVFAYDDSIPDEAWLPCGPVAPIRVGMVSYRWAVTHGFNVLNWRDYLAE
jgi:hypothetical protein